MRSGNRCAERPANWRRSCGISLIGGGIRAAVRVGTRPAEWAPHPSGGGGNVLESASATYVEFDARPTDQQMLPQESITSRGKIRGISGFDCTTTRLKSIRPLPIESILRPLVSLRHHLPRAFRK